MRRRAAIAACLVLAACGGRPGPLPTPARAGPAAPPAATTHGAPTQVSRSFHGMVVSGSPLASEIGAHVLESGGNAVDAAVATAFALSVVEPTMSGIGGRTQMLIRTAEGEFYGLDGTTQVPAGYAAGQVWSGDAYGYGTIGIPGTVAALARALAEFGTLPLSDVIAPAVALAEDGFPLPNGEAARIAAAQAELSEFEGSRRYFLKPDGSPYRAGERFVQADLAGTLRAIAAGGAPAFYRGQIAQTIARDVRANGGFVSVADLAGYEVRNARIVRGSYRGFGLVGTYLPASGATTIEALHILETFDRAELDDPVEWASLVAQALLLSFEDRTAALGSPAEQARRLVSKEWARERRGAIRVPWQRAGTGAGSSAVPEIEPEPEHTTHLSVADRWGGVVALTQSVGPSLGSKVAAPGLGFVYAATMGYLSSAAPGDRAWSSQSPLVLLKDGEPVYVLGAAGARRIISAIVQVTSRSIDHGISLGGALAAPRFHPAETLTMEVRPGTAWTEVERRRLGDLGFAVETRADAAYFARIHGIQADPLTGEWIGVADPRWIGTARGARR